MIHPNQVQETTQNPYIKPGVYYNVNITSIEYKAEDGIPPRIVLNYETQDGLVLEDDAWFLTEKAENYTVGKLKHIAKALNMTDTLNQIFDKAIDEGKGYDEVVKALDKNLTGNTIPVMKFQGKEIEGKEGRENWVKAKTSLPPFASNDPENHSLTFDKENDIEYLETTDSDEVVVEEKNSDDGLGFD